MSTSLPRTLCGCRVRVELSNGEKRSRNRGPPPSWGRRPRDDYRRRSPPPRRRYPRAKNTRRVLTLLPLSILEAGFFKSMLMDNIPLSDDNLEIADANKRKKKQNKPPNPAKSR